MARDDFCRRCLNVRLDHRCALCESAFRFRGSFACSNAKGLSEDSPPFVRDDRQADPIRTNGPTTGGRYGTVGAMPIGLPICPPIKGDRTEACNCP